MVIPKEKRSGHGQRVNPAYPACSFGCLERNFERRREVVSIKGRDFYDLLWFMQQGVWPLEEKLAQDGQQLYTVRTARLALQEKIAYIRPRDLAVDLLPMFESRAFIEAWLDALQENFQRLVERYLRAEKSRSLITPLRLHWILCLYE